MVSEPQRLQYLEAMGLTAWTARYRLPNAAPTPQCEWPELDAPQDLPQARLHALLEAAPSEADHVSAPRPAAAEATVVRRDAAASPARSARALLGGLAESGMASSRAAAVAPASDRATTTAAPMADTTPANEAAPEHGGSERQVALRFTLQLAVLDGRWLLLLPQQVPPGKQSVRLLARLFEAAGIRLEAPPAFFSFKWPIMDNLPVTDALEEARHGLRAFIDGRSQDWQLERVLSFGSCGDELERVLDFSGELHHQSTCLLALPCWQGPALDALGESAEQKRKLWPELARWRQWWHGDQHE